MYDDDDDEDKEENDESVQEQAETIDPTVVEELGRMREPLNFGYETSIFRFQCLVRNNGKIVRLEHNKGTQVADEDDGRDDKYKNLCS